ncbi:Arc family DNA-binding protein [Paraburkholderia sp. A3BS-1L]|uniref:Arc family DNA-binding protein n=1 Tax=Paraburkholderia sp. A3BS-1L TaxID=3028375 RepID=UPI003DA9CB3B
MTTRPPTSHIPPFGLRMQPDLKIRLEEAAKANSRSLNAEIVARLEATFAPNADHFLNMQRYNELKQEILEYVLTSIEAKKKAK